VGDAVWPLTPDGERFAGGPGTVEAIEVGRYGEAWAVLGSDRRVLVRRLERLEPTEARRCAI
jgi:hypothetical protein